MDTTNPRRAAGAAFTLVEMLVASSISTLVMAGVVTTFVWSIRQATLSSKVSWSQNEAMKTSAKLAMYVRNAVEVAAMDNEGTWVQLRFVDGSTARLAYSNDVPNLRDGRLYLQRANGSETIVARGMTRIQDSNGGATPLFRMSRGNCMNMAYRVSEPREASNPAADGQYAAHVRLAVCLRNATQ